LVAAADETPAFSSNHIHEQTADNHPGTVEAPIKTMRHRLTIPIPATVAMLGLLQAGWLGLCGPALADAGAPDLIPPPTNNTFQVLEGPEALKHQVRLTIETNAPADNDTNGTPRNNNAFHWKFSWQGWDGLHFGLSRESRFKDPLADIRARMQGSNSIQFFHLEQMKMTGKIGGKLALDGAAYVTGRDAGGFDPGIELRRARLFARGDCLLVLPVSYQLEIGYIPSQFYIEESYLSFKNLPLIGELKLGQYQAPMGLDVVSSCRDITFMESAAPLQALAPGVNAGFQIGQAILNQRATWKLGFFTDGVGKDYGDATTDYGRAVLRLTGLPFCQLDSGTGHPTKLLHLGASANILYSASSSVRYQSRPESHLAPYVIDTGDIDAKEALVIGSEAAWINGPFSVQGEFLYSSVIKVNGEIPNFNGFYVSSSWFLTGESQPYDRAEGTFGRVIPKRNFTFGPGGWGAWEIGARYSFVNLDSADVRGGRLSMLMMGVNWHLHPNVKWRFNYGFGHVTGPEPAYNINVFQTRVEMDF
jgi:phosphate-selective porin OprO/OprP